MPGPVFDIKNAVAIAVTYVRSLGEVLPSSDLRLEETIFKDDSKWLVTLSFLNPNLPMIVDRRIYKTIEIDPNSGRVVAMRMRNPDMAA